MSAYNRGTSLRGHLLPWQIVDEVVAVDGLLERVFGKLLPFAVFDQNVENDLTILEKVYQFENIRELCPRKIHWRSFKYLNNTVFRFSEDVQAKQATQWQS